MTRCEQCEIWKKTINPTNHDQICGCECHKAKPAQLVDIIKTKPGVEPSVAEDAEVKKSTEIKTKPQVNIDLEERAEVKQARCKCQWLPWLRKCYGHCSKPAKLLDIAIAKEVQTANTIKIKPLVDVSIAEGVQQSDYSKTKSAAQIFMVEKQVKLYAKKKMRAKLALLEKEVELAKQLLQQSKTLQESKEALLMKKVRVKYNKCHKFWRGSVVSAHKSFVEEQVEAAKARLGVEKHNNQFNISSMVDTIDKLAPGGCYNSAKPSSSPTSTSRPGVRPTSVPRRSSRFIVPPPPITHSGPAMKSSPAPAAVPQTSPGNRGEKCIVSYGDVFAQELFYDNSTQLEFGADNYIWDGDNSAIISEDAKELEVETCYYDAEVESCSYDDEVVYCYDAEVEDFNYDAVDYFEL